MAFTTSTTRRLLAVAILCLPLAIPLGCNKVISQYYRNKAKDRMAQAEALNAAELTKDQLAQTNATLTQAESSAATEDYAAASASGKTAAQQAADLLEQTKRKRAQQTSEFAAFWIGKGTLNEANAVDEGLFNQIKEQNEAGIQLRNEEKWDRAIATFLKVEADMKSLLNSLQVEAKNGLEEARTMRQDLATEGATENAPEYVVQIDEQIRTIDSAINTDYDYRKALLVRNQARQTRTEGITKTKEVKSQRLITEIENLLDTATQLGAELYASQNFLVITKEYEGLLGRFYDRNYDTVLVEGPVLKPKVDELILETKRNGAQAKIDAVRTAINNLTDGKAREYLIGSVEQLDALLADSQRLFDAQDYTQSKAVSERALEVEQRIISDFDDLAAKNIASAMDQLTIADGVFSRMAEIFDQPVPGDWSGADKALEDSKQALKQELQGSVQNAKLAIGVAQIQRRDDRKFASAIEISRQVAADSENIQQQTYRVVAHNAILEISNSLTRYEKDGGRTYAAAEVDKTIGMLNEAHGLLDQGQYRESVRRAADTKAQVEVIGQELARVADTGIARAQKAIAAAGDNRAQDFAADTLGQSKVALDRAMDSLSAASMRESIESAAQAEAIAEDASSRALKTWAEEFIAESDAMLAKAREAGSERYAPEQLQAALELRRNLQRLYDQTAYAAAVDTGRQSVDAAGAAYFYLINEGENAIAAAREYGAWEYQPERLTNAMVSLKYARAALDSGDYKNAELHAYNAVNLASKLQVEAKRGGFEARMAALEKRIDAAESQGAALFQSKEIAKIMAEMNQLRNEFDPKGYEDYSKRVEQLDTRLASLIEKAPDSLKELVLAMQDRLTGLEARGARGFMPDLAETVDRKIKYAQIDFRAEKFHSSYMNIRDAHETLQAIDLQLAEREFDGKLNDILGDYNNELARFDDILQMGPETLLRLIAGYDGRTLAVSLAQRTSPSGLRLSINDFMARARALEAPYTRRNQKAAALEVFNVGATAAANFEKMLIMDQYDMRESRDIVQAAYNQLAMSRKLEADLMKSIRYPQVRFEPRGVERVVSIND